MVGVKEKTKASCGGNLWSIFSTYCWCKNFWLHLVQECDRLLGGGQGGRECTYVCPVCVCVCTHTQRGLWAVFVGGRERERERERWGRWKCYMYLFCYGKKRADLSRLSSQPILLRNKPLLLNEDHLKCLRTRTKMKVDFSVINDHSFIGVSVAPYWP